MADLVNKNDILRYIRCTTGSETYALDMTSVYSIQRSDNLRLEAVANNMQIGWFHVREARAPVYSLGQCLGRARQGNQAGQRIVLMNPLSGDAAMWALAVDQVSQVYATTPQLLSPLPQVLCTGTERYFQAVLRAGDELLLMLEPSGIHPDRPVAVPGMLPEPEIARAFSDNIAERAAIAGGSRTRQKQLIVFGLPGVKEDIKFALSIAQVLEILAPLPVVPAPGASPFILGLINWRNRPVPLVDLTRRFVLSGANEADTQRLMIVRDVSKKQEQVFGFFVQPNIHMLRLPVTYRTEASQVSIPKAFVKAVIEIDGQQTVIPEVSKILGL